jgi:hypothetical protein
MTNYTNYTEEFKVRILTDYADTEKTCWASDSGKTVAECWCAQCIEGRTLYPALKEQKVDFENAQHLLAERNTLKELLSTANQATNTYRDRIAKIAGFIQSSIDRDEWTESELEEPFWTELAEMLDIDLKQTEEIEVTFTATYSAWVTVPKNTDVTELEIDLAWHPDVTLNGDGVGSANQDNVEVDPA